VRHNFTLADAKIQGGGGSDFQKRLQLADESKGRSEALQDSGPSLPRNTGAEEENIAQQKNATRSAHVGRYLRPDGRRKPQGELMREFRDERNATRRRNQFLRRVDAGGFDPRPGGAAAPAMRLGVGCATPMGWALARLVLAFG
jgi:hypothetical protein